jgi:arylformamidase
VKNVPANAPGQAAGPAAPPEWFDAQYNNRARIPEHLDILRQWDERSHHARASLACTLDLAYGSEPSERLDLFTPAAAGAPVLVYIHGGYWRALDKRDQSFVAAPFVAAGAMVVLPNYALCPAVSIEHIVLQLVRSLAWVWRHAAEHGGDPTRIVVAGHSAGGHLAAMMLSCDWQAVAPDLPADLVQSALAVSGVFELEPLRHAPFLAPDLRLDAALARKLSPVAMPAPRGHLVAVVGADESEEFLRQNALIAEAWGRRAVPVSEQVPGRHHMNVLHELADPASRTHGLTLQLLGLARASGAGWPAPLRSPDPRLKPRLSS